MIRALSNKDIAEFNTLKRRINNYLNKSSNNVF